MSIPKLLTTEKFLPNIAIRGKVNPNGRGRLQDLGSYIIH